MEKMVNMKRKSILLSLLLAIFVVGGMFAQEPTYSKMSPYTRILLDKLAKKDTANSLLRSSISGDYLSAFVKVATDEGWLPWIRPGAVSGQGREISLRC